MAVGVSRITVGRLIQAVETAGQMRNRIFVFLSDHGEMLGSYGLWRKGSWHSDCMIRVPGFVCAPGRLGGQRRINGLVQAIDLAPTILGMLGLPVHERMQGMDFSGQLLRDEAIRQRWIYSEMWTTLWGSWVRCWTIRTETAKLDYYPSDRVGHLFDLAADPDERNDLWASPRHRDLRGEMLASLLQHQGDQVGNWPKVFCQC
jgi:arylsulfatase A-like enzyme